MKARGLSLDVSPDGKSIAFELVGDIFTLPIEGGQAKLISGGMAFDSQPKFRRMGSGSLSSPTAKAARTSGSCIRTELA